MIFESLMIHQLISHKHISISRFFLRRRRIVNCVEMCVLEVKNKLCQCSLVDDGNNVDSASKLL